MDRTIRVNGVGKLSLKPDQIILPITLEARDADYQRAVDMGAGQLDAVRSAVGSAGFLRDRLKTLNFSVSPEFDSVQDEKGRYQRVFKGYLCSHQLKLEFELNMPLLSTTFAALAQCPANPEFSVQFTVKDKDAVNDELLRLAAKNARAKAGILAEASGVRLGELISVDYSWGELRLVSATTYDSGRNQMLSKRAMDIDVEPDDIVVNDTVNFVWSME